LAKAEKFRSHGSPKTGGGGPAQTGCPWKRFFWGTTQEGVEWGVRKPGRKGGEEDWKGESGVKVTRGKKKTR